MDTNVVVLTSEELAHMRDTKSKKGANHEDPVWIKAFDLARDNGVNAFGMRCGKCYDIVYNYFAKKVLD